MLQHLDILGDRCAGKALFGRRLCERGGECAERREVELTVAPLQHLHGIEGVALKRLHKLRLERRAASRGAERPIAHRAPRAPCDLSELRGIELAELIAVELAIGGERHMIDIEVQAHADRIGCDQIVHIARLVERDLRIARARRERTQYDGGAAALAADQFGDRVDFVG